LKPTCHGCCHEASEPCKAKHIHRPSGETACGSCTRNFLYQFKVLKKKDYYMRDYYMTMEELKGRMKKDEEKRWRLMPERVKFT
jgi:transcription elongation factor Elf1